MSWECPEQDKYNCKKLKKKCSPGQKGCRLYGKVRPAREIEKKKHLSRNIYKRKYKK